MADYAINNTTGTKQAITSSYQTLLVVNAVTANLRRGKLYDLMFGTLGTPADQTYQFDLARETAAGTPTATLASAPLDPADSASSTLCYSNYTAEPTATNISLFNLGINQRASYRWVAAPGSEFVWPATNLFGLGLRTASASGGTAVATASFLFQEQ